MNIGNITSDNFNLDGNGKDIQIEVYEQLIEKLQQENQQQNQLLKDKGFIIDKLMEENKQLKDNWNKLKEIVKSQSDFKLKARFKEVWFEVDELLSKMEELEKGVNND